MNTTRLPHAMALMAMALFCFLVSRPAAAVTTTTLYSTSFTSSSDFYAWSGYMSSFDGWYWTSPGRGGYNGSIGFNTYYGGTSQSIYSPMIDASSFSTDNDSTFVEFDLCMPKNYYMMWYPITNEFIVRVGGTQITKITSKDYSNGSAYTYGYYSSPSNFTSTYYWKHYRFAIPKSARTASMQIELAGRGVNDWGWWYPDAQPFWIDNILVSNAHYTNITYGPKSLAFGNLGKGLVSDAKYVVVNNPNTSPVNLSNIAVTGSNTGDFQIVYTPSGPIAPGTSDSIGVVFAPTFKNFRSANLVFNTDVDLPTRVTVDMSGFGLVPVISMADHTYFRKTHTKFNDDVTTSIPFTNSGLSPLILDTVATYIDGDASDQYVMLSHPTQPIMPGAMDSIVVQFTPVREGQQAAYLHLNSNADNGEQVITLKANGIVPHLEISPRQVLFDTANVGQKQNVTITLFNSGTDTLAITRNFLTGSDYDFTTTSLTGSDTLLMPSESKTITITFDPLRSGTRVARLHMTTNIPLTFESPRRDTSTFDVNIMGYANPIGILSTNVVRPDTGIIGIQSCQTGSFTNTGSADLTVTSAKIVGADSADFALSGLTFPVTVAMGGSQSYSLCTTPGARGDRQAQLVLTGLSNGQPLSVTLPLAAYGLQVCANAAATTNLGSHTCAGYTDTATITVTNCGDVATAYTASMGGSASDFTLVGNATSATIAPNGTATFRVAYTPTARGAANTSITITGGTGVTPMDVQITGTGSAATIVGSGTAPATAVGATSSPFEVGVQNTGECDFVPGVPTVTGPFTYVSGGTTPIAPGASGTLMFTYSPTTSGNSVGVVSFPNAVGVSLPAANVTISGSTAASVASAEAYGFSLGQNYPNPFFPKTQIDFVVPYTTRVTLDLLDAKGSFIGTLYNGVAEQGTHTAMVDASTITRAADIRMSDHPGAALTSGTYFYRLTSENPTGAPVMLVRQMILVK